MDSTTSTEIFGGSDDFSTSSDNSDLFGNKSNSSTWVYILILLALFGFLYCVLSGCAENFMTMGTLAQIQSLDSQDLYLTGGDSGITDQLASRNTLFYWGQSTRNGGNRGTYSPIPIISQKTQQKIDELDAINPSDLKLNSAPFPRVNPTSTVSPYPGIREILINQKEDEDYIEKELGKDMRKDQFVNTMRNQSMNNLQGALVNSCQSCVPGKCNNCPACSNGKTSYPRGDSVATNKVDAKSIGLLDNDFVEDYESVENFDSGLNNSSQSIPSKLHNNLTKKLVDKQSLFANDSLENFDSGIQYSTIPSKMHRVLTKKLVKSCENFDSGLSAQTMPTKLHNKLTKKIVKQRENFDKDMIDLDDPLRANTGTCANCPQSNCINCPKRSQSFCNSGDCALGYPCKTCKTLKYLNDRDQIIDANEPDNNSREHFACACNRKVKIMTATNLNQKYADDHYKENFTKLIDNNSQREQFQCSLNPDSTECNGCLNQCPCRLGNCSNCLDCRGEKCKSCPNRRCPCLLSRCKDCYACRSGNCPMCPNNKVGEQIKNDQNENFESIGFKKLCPCNSGKCTNCQECRFGKCDTCPRSKETSAFIDLASLGTWHGGSRLGTNWNNATTSPMSVNVADSLVYYPDSYLGSYFINPKPDIMRPYNVIPQSRTVAGLVVKNSD
jgi:hypothetical protein